MSRISQFFENLNAARVYEYTQKFFLTTGPPTFGATLFIDAPFGRFAPSSGKWLVDGIKSWIVMELVSPLTFMYCYITSPLSPTNRTPNLSARNPASLMAYLFVIHYANRSLVSPLRTPSRSKSHLMVPLVAIFFNLLNGSMNGTYLSSPTTQRSLTNATSRPSFWLGITLWALGFAGNIIHDEILLNLRRNRVKSSDGKEHYAIPYGGLYRWISYPNYFCEWIEWAGFSLAASPSFFGANGLPTAPWIFTITEVFTMLPRAIKGHRWYLEKFPDYPKDRKVAIPYVL